MAISVGIGSLTYDYTGSDTSAKYTETGKGTALSLDVKFYPGKRRLQGFYVGPGVGMADIKIDWTDKVGTFTRRGTGSGTGTEVHGKAGYAFLAGPLTIDPNLQVGYFVAMPSSNSGRTSTLSVYVLLGLNIGFRF